MTRRAYRHFVTLHNSPTVTDDSDGIYDLLSPPNAWASIAPLGPGDTDRTVQSRVEMDFHPQVGLETRITFGARHLFVRGLQNVDARDVTLVLICDEAI